ncbi:hypothetical protein H6F73_04180 [Microcoleus sp. FACHB-68]|nr:hypothetical protein [Microcoleus sp. FACHB-68]
MQANPRGKLRLKLVQEKRLIGRSNCVCNSTNSGIPIISGKRYCLSMANANQVSCKNLMCLTVFKISAEAIDKRYINVVGTLQLAEI